MTNPQALTRLQKVLIECYQEDGEINPNELPKVADAFSRWTDGKTRLAKARQVADLVNNSDLIGKPGSSGFTAGEKFNSFTRLRSGTIQEVEQAKTLLLAKRAQFIATHESAQKVDQWAETVPFRRLDDETLKSWLNNSQLPPTVRVRAFDTLEARRSKDLKEAISFALLTPGAPVQKTDIDFPLEDVMTKLRKESATLQSESASKGEKILAWLVLMEGCEELSIDSHKIAFPPELTITLSDYIALLSEFKGDLFGSSLDTHGKKADAHGRSSRSHRGGRKHREQDKIILSRKLILPIDTLERARTVFKAFCEGKDS